MLEKCTTIVNEEDVAKAYNSLLQNHHQDPEPTLLNRAQKKSFVQEVEAKHEAKTRLLISNKPSLSTNSATTQSLSKSLSLSQSKVFIFIDGGGCFNGSCIRNGRFEGFADDVDFV